MRRRGLGPGAPTQHHQPPASQLRRRAPPPSLARRHASRRQKTAWLPTRACRPGPPAAPGSHLVHHPRHAQALVDVVVRHPRRNLHATGALAVHLHRQKGKDRGDQLQEGRQDGVCVHVCVGGSKEGGRERGRHESGQCAMVGGQDGWASTTQPGTPHHPPHATHLVQVCPRVAIGYHLRHHIDFPAAPSLEQGRCRDARLGRGVDVGLPRGPRHQHGQAAVGRGASARRERLAPPGAEASGTSLVRGRHMHACLCNASSQAGRTGSSSPAPAPTHQLLDAPHLAVGLGALLLAPGRDLALVLVA